LDQRQDPSLEPAQGVIEMTPNIVAPPGGHRPVSRLWREAILECSPFLESNDILVGLEANALTREIIGILVLLSVGSVTSEGPQTVQHCVERSRQAVDLMKIAARQRRHLIEIEIADRGRAPLRPSHAGHETC
jgi:hypothetical protein